MKMNSIKVLLKQINYKKIKIIKITYLKKIELKLGGEGIVVRDPNAKLYK